MKKRSTALAAVRVEGGWASRAAYARTCGLSGPTCWRIETSTRPVRRSTLDTYGLPLGLDAEEIEQLRRGDRLPRSTRVALRFSRVERAALLRLLDAYLSTEETTDPDLLVLRTINERIKEGA